ncbi:MAG: hypothetical protein B7Z58_18270 [Acidiphilium sp. 37-64-53]|jgi:hypothetical protein|uniref:MobQ family relaxase n=1 Tax=Acidiphilium sp. 37-64-53 TaxID=1970299 RepID=UPI000BC50B52|nr:MobQ family relaxase [Acidiphilium sp. 37-64-53]OYV99623.1 MAG: hypothetical protein B7Z58_18270 [Acidiphilium sp. 37-64-53]
MASYHLSAKAVSRSTGRSAVGAAAYRSGERLTNERDGVTHDYTRKGGVLSSFIVAPASAEAWASDRSGLWNRAEAAEARKDAKVAREYELALPAELSAPEREALARQFAEAVVERFGVVADVALHAPHREGDQRNWHAHILTTTRAANENGLGAKTRVLDSPKTSGAEVEALRELWAKQVNAALERARETARVDHRSFARRDAERGFDPRDRIRPPGVHLGPAATAIERRAARERVRSLSDDAGRMAQNRAKQLRGASRRDAMREERSERHFEVAQARLEAREAASEVVQLEAERERLIAVAAAQKAAEAAQRAAERQKAKEPAPVTARSPTISPARRQQMESFIKEMRRTQIQKLDRQTLDATEKSREMQTRLGWAVTGREKAKEALIKAENWESVRKGELDEAAKNLKEIRDNSPFRAWLHDRKIWRSDLLAAAETAVNTAKQNHDHACYLTGNARTDLDKQATQETLVKMEKAIEDQQDLERDKVAKIEAMRQALHSPEWLDEAERQVNHMLDVQEIVGAGQLEQSWGQARFSHPPGLSAQEIERRDAVLAEQPEITKVVMEKVAQEKDRGRDYDD